MDLLALCQQYHRHNHRNSLLGENVRNQSLGYAQSSIFKPKTNTIIRPDRTIYLSNHLMLPYIRGRNDL